MKKLGDRKTNIQNYEAIYLLSYSILLVVLILNTSFFQQYLDHFWKPIMVFCLGALLLNETLFGWLSKQELAMLLIVAVCMVVTGRYATGPDSNSVAFLFALIFCGRHISFNKIAAVSLLVSSLSLIIIVVSASSGIILNYIEYGARLRYYLGFKYSLFGPVLLANIIKLWIYIRKQRFTFAEFCFLFSINYWFYYRTNSRLAFFLTALLLLVLFFLKKKLYILLKSRAICIIMVGAFIIAALISILLTIKYDPTSAWMARLNTVFGGRLSLGNESIETYGIALFPNPNFNLVGNGLDAYGNRSTLRYNYVDCFYVQLLQRYGIFIFACFIIVVTYTMYISYKKKDLYYLIIMVFIAAHCMIDDLLIYVHYNTFWLAIGSFIATNHFKKATKETSE